MSHPSSYTTLKGLCRATGKVLQASLSEHGRFDGMSRGMWLTNARFAAQTTFRDTESIQALQQKYAITRPQDLLGGNSLFGIPLPVREYIEGDNIPGVGRVDEVYGDQLCVAGNWFHKRCFEQAV